MKVMDEKGKLFGKINIIDLLVLIAIVFVGIILGGKLLGNNTDFAGSTKLTYTVKVENVSEDVYLALEKMELPDQLMTAGDLLNGKVTSISAEKSIKQELQVVPNSKGTPSSVTLTAPDTYDILFTIEAFVANDVKNELGTQEIRVGKTHIVKTQHFELEDGIITSCISEKAS